MGFKTNKCCCGDTHGAATMWLLDYNYGYVLQDFNWVYSGIGTPISLGCSFDSYSQAAEAGPNLTGFLWNADPPESILWGPTSNPFTGAGGFLVSGLTTTYVWYGRGNVVGGITTVAKLRADGSAYTHGVLGGLLRTSGDEVFTYTQSGGRTHRRYDEDSTLITSAAMTAQSNGQLLTHSGNGLHFHLNIDTGHHFWAAVDPATLSVDATYFDILTEDNPGAPYGNDEAGGLYLRHAASNVLSKFSGGGGSGTPDWSVTAPSGATVARFGQNGSIYIIRTISSVVNLSRISGVDGSVVWDAPLPGTVDEADIFIDRNTVYEGAIYIPTTNSVWAIDEATGDTLWHTTNPICGSGKPVPTPLGLLCCGEYS